jgi:hypothetical protein
MSADLEPYIDRKKVQQEVKSELEKEDFLLSLIALICEHYFTLFMTIIWIIIFPFIWGVSFLYSNRDENGVGFLLIAFAIVAAIIFFRLRRSALKKIDQKTDMKINQLKIKFIEEQKEKQIEEFIIEYIKTHENEGYIKLSLVKLVNKKNLNKSQLLETLYNLKRKGLVSGDIDKKKSVLILKKVLSTYPCPKCNKELKPHWIVCPYCQIELE